MTKAETDFAQDDRDIARRAAWLLDGHAPSQQQPPPDQDLGPIHRAVGKHGFLRPLAHFAMIRDHDAVRATGAPADERGSEAEVSPDVTASRLRLRMQADAGLDEKRANQQLRESKLRVDNAVKHWLAASEKRADDWGRIPLALQTGEHQAVLGEVLAAAEAVDRALGVMDAAMRRVVAGEARDPFPSTLGLPKSERNASLNAQALALFTGGVSLEEIAYVMGWWGGSPGEIRDRARQRLAEARARLGGIEDEEDSEI